LKTNGANDVGFLAFHYVDEKKDSYSRLSIMLMKIKAHRRWTRIEKNGRGRGRRPEIYNDILPIPASCIPARLDAE
jgi:hypothetical protein